MADELDALHPTPPAQAPDPTPAQESDLLGDEAVWTPEIEVLGKAIANRIRMDQPGMSIDGPQRNGKSWACAYVSQVLPTVLGAPVASVLWTIPGEHCRSEREFHQQRMHQSGCPAMAHRDLEVLRTRLYDHLVQTAHGAGSRRLVIFVDEAQNLLPANYNYLIHCFNELERRRVRPFFALVGQPELRDVRKQWVAVDGHQVIGRFLAHRHEYRGIAVADLEVVLGSFDEAPGEEGTSAIRRALPEAYARGWRVASLASLLAEAFQLVVREQNIKQEVRIPMQYLRGMLLAMLYWLIESKCPPERVGLGTAVDCVKATDIGGVLQYYADHANAGAPRGA